MRQPRDCVHAGLLAALCCGVTAAREASAAEGLLPLPRLEGPVVVDGRPDEAAWQALAPLPLTTYAPTHRGAPTQRSEIRVAHDHEAPFAAGRLYDEDPA